MEEAADVPAACTMFMLFSTSALVLVLLEAENQVVASWADYPFTASTALTVSKLGETHLVLSLLPDQLPLPQFDFGVTPVYVPDPSIYNDGG